MLVAVLMLIPLMLLITSCAKKQSSVTQEEVEQTILAIEHKAMDRWSADSDPFGFIENFADDGTYFDDLGASTRLDGLEEIKNHLAAFEGSIPPHSYEIVDPKVQVYGDIAIATWHYASNSNGEPDTPWKVTHVYRLINGKWFNEHAHWSLVK
ncbi:YybH family protein [Candidatus Neomarinimicrobiota bacterium]